MATVAMYDADMAKYTHVPFNLDIMKLSAYYKKNNNITRMITQPNIDRYSKLIYRKDYYDGEFDSNILLNEKVEYGGFAFSPEKFINLGDAEHFKPDKYIYEPYRKIFGNNRKNRDLFDTMMRAQHVRLSLDGEKPWNNWESQIDTMYRKTTCIFHDYDLSSIENSWDIMSELYLKDKARKYLGTKFPIQVYTEDELMNWSKFYSMGFFYTIKINGIKSDQCIYDFIQETQHTSVTRQAIYNITYGCKNEADVLEKLPSLFKQIVFFRMKRVKMLLEYDDTIFSNQEVINILELVSQFMDYAFRLDINDYNRIIPYDSLYNFIATNSVWNEKRIYALEYYNQIPRWFSWLSIEEKRDAFRFIQKHNPELFKMFYECHQVKLKGGEFQYD